MATPRVSILMGARNCAATLEEAIESIRAQDYTDWEFIICDDGSTDGTWETLGRLAASDSRIRLLRNSSNIGLAATLNRCAAESKGELLARMDGDDISVPSRLRKLIRALDSHPELAVVSSWMTAFDELGDWGEMQTREFPEARDFIRGTPFCHAPCMIRRSAFLEVGGYRESRWAWRVEDYDLWFRMAKRGLKGMNLQESLYRVRDNRDAENRRSFRARLNETLVRLRGFYSLGLPIWTLALAFRPIAVWMIPAKLYRRLRKSRLRSQG